MLKYQVRRSGGARQTLAALILLSALHCCEVSGVGWLVVVSLQLQPNSGDMKALDGCYNLLGISSLSKAAFIRVDMLDCSELICCYAARSNKYEATDL